MSTETTTPAPASPQPAVPPLERAAPPSDQVTAAPSSAPPQAPAKAPPRAPAVPTPEFTGGWGIALAVLVTGMFMSVLDVSIVNVAIPAMQKEYGSTTDDIQWVATAYSLALGVVVPASAWLGEKIGLKRAYLVSLVGFSIGSALCGIAWDLNSMIAFRILQAIPGGIIPVVALSMLYRIVPREKIGTAMGMYGLGIVVAPAVGPTLGGYLVEYVDWRLIFFINVPIGVIGAVAAAFLLPRFRGGTAHRFDVPGFLTIAAGLFSLLLALSEGETWGWTGYRVLILLTVSLLSLALFVIIELEVEHPLLDVRVFTTWPFTNSLILISVVSIGLFGVLFYIPLYLQQYQGLGAFDTGLLLLPQALVMAVMMPMAGRIYDRFGARWPAVIGLSVVAIGTYLLHDLSIDTPHGELQWILAFRAGGIGLSMMPIMTNGLSSVPPRLTTNASAFNNLTQRTSAAMGLAAMTALMTTLQAQDTSDRGAVMGATSTPTMAGHHPLGPSAIVQQYGMMQNASAHVFTDTFGNLMLVLAGLSAGAALLALPLRSKGSSSGSEESVVVEA